LQVQEYGGGYGDSLLSSVSLASSFDPFWSSQGVPAIYQSTVAVLGKSGCFVKDVDGVSNDSTGDFGNQCQLSSNTVATLINGNRLPLLFSGTSTLSDANYLAPDRSGIYLRWYDYVGSQYRYLVIYCDSGYPDFGRNANINTDLDGQFRCLAPTVGGNNHIGYSRTMEGAIDDWLANFQY